MPRVWTAWQRTQTTAVSLKQKGMGKESTFIPSTNSSLICTDLKLRVRKVFYTLPHLLKFHTAIWGAFSLFKAHMNWK
jgi:hypothetical protein